MQRKSIGELALSLHLTGSVHNNTGYIHCVKNNHRKRWVYSESLDGYIRPMEKPAGKAQVLLGRRIRSLRNEKKWTLEKLGEIANTNHKHIGEIERGLQNASFAVLVKIAAALGVELRELFRFEQEDLSRKQVEAQIVHILQSLPDGDLNRMLSVLRVLYPVS